MPHGVGPPASVGFFHLGPQQDGRPVGVPCPLEHDFCFLERHLGLLVPCLGSGGLEEGPVLLIHSLFDAELAERVAEFFDFHVRLS